MNQKTKRLQEVVLVGGGHSHVQVLKHLAMEPLPDSRLTVVVDRPVAVYSGMVPGFVAGQYRAEELEIDVVPLARRAKARVILAPAIGIDPRAKRIEIEGRPSIPYDVASFDIGSTVVGLELPGIREYALPTRPIGRFVQRVDELVDRARDHQDESPFRVVVVGGGAGGIELLFTLEQRLRSLEVPASLLLLHNGPRILAGYPDSLLRRALRCADKRGLGIRCDETVVAAERDVVRLESGEQIPYDALIWVTGAVGYPLFRDSLLSTEPRGFVQTRSTLQVEGHDDLFAVGDCATLIDHPRTPKAGVYAVRQGPFITENLRARIEGGKLRRYRPQEDFLTLLNLGDGRALGAKWGFSIEGAWVMKLKDWIDRRFMRRFQVLDRSGAPTQAFEAQDEMGEAEMLCGGCAAKLGQSALHRALDRLGAGAEDPAVELGLASPDDAAVYRSPGGERIASSLDAFRAFTDDPYLLGRVAAVNAVSDLYAKGVEPRYAQSLVALPQELAESENEELLYQVLAGARAAFEPLGVTLVGGHTTTAPELLVGFGVEGFVSDSTTPLALDRLEEDQVLILTKPLGTGVLFHADIKGLARGPWIEAAIASMLRPNAVAAQTGRGSGATAATDITGFGLAGHLAEMLRASRLSAILDVSSLPALPGAVELLGQGLRSTFHPENERAKRGMVIDSEAAASERFELLFDPQTSGGLLFGIESGRAEEALAFLHLAGDLQAAIVGKVAAPRPDGALIEVVPGGVLVLKNQVSGEPPEPLEP
jgi:selenide,water dikinase